MTRASVISVDPGKSTLGDLNPAATARTLRYRVLNREADSAASFRRVLDSVFAVGKVSRVPDRGVKLLLVRMVAGVVLLFSGLSVGFGGVIPSASVIASAGFTPTPASVMLLVVAVSLCLGFFTRLTLSASALCFAVLFAQQLSAGVFEQTYAFIAVLCMVFAIKGPGRLSLDAMTRRVLYSTHRARARRMARRRLSYEAFRYEHF